MPNLVVHGATLRCNQGPSPSSLSVVLQRAARVDNGNIDVTFFDPD